MGSKPWYPPGQTCNSATPPACRCGWRTARLRTATGLAEQRRPAHLVRLAVPHRQLRHLVGRRGVVPVVQHRTHEQLTGQRWSTTVTGHERQRRRDTAAGAAPDQDEPLRVDAQLSGVLRRPDQAGEAVLDRAGMRYLWREPVLDRDDRRHQLLGEVQHLGQTRPDRCRRSCRRRA